MLKLAKVSAVTFVMLVAGATAASASSDCNDGDRHHHKRHPASYHADKNSHNDYDVEVEDNVLAYNEFGMQVIKVVHDD